MAISRRAFTCAAAGAGLSIITPTVRADVTPATKRPQITGGVASGDVTADSAVIWARCDRDAQFQVEIATTESFRNARRVTGPDALADRDHIGKLHLRKLPPGQRVFYRVRFRDLEHARAKSEPVVGSFVTAPAAMDRRAVTFAWSGDTAGQGWGIDVARGGMRTYATMLTHDPDFFIHCGDTVYADGPFPAEQKMPDGGVWKNVTTEGTAKVAETLDEFRANFRYNLLDDHVRAFNARVPMLAQWDDHETTNNWYPDERLDGDKRYTVKSADLLAARARRAFFDYMPIADISGKRQRVYRSIERGPHVEVFMLDMRTHRGANSANDQATPGKDTAILGNGQMRWLKERLLRCKATWKVIASDMPLGLVVGDGGAFEAVANGKVADGAARGRELEIADLLRFIRHNDVRNVVWFTADVHYAASHHYSPERAVFKDFTPFWEFVSGPLHAGTFGPGTLDPTFGPQAVWASRQPGAPQNLPPSAGEQYFGIVRIDESGVMTVTHYNVGGEKLWSKELTPA